MSITIRTFALSLISIFVPIYLLKIGYPLTDVLIFYIILYGSNAILSFFAAKLSLKIGFKHAFTLSIPFLIVFYILLYTLPTYGWPLGILAMIYGINNALFWISFHVDFAKYSVKKIRGEEISILRIITSVLHMVGPLIGAVIISFTNFYYLFILVSLFLIVSLVPIFYSKDIHGVKKVSLKDLFKISSLKNFLVFIGNGVENGAGNVIWPIFVFLIVGGYLSLGAIASIATFFSLLFVFIAGRLCDKIKRSVILKFGSILQSLIWLFKSFVTTAPQAFLINSFSGITNTFKDIPYHALVYDKASKGNLVEFIVLREIGIQLGRVIFFTLMILLVVLYKGLILAGVASLFYLLF